jgi:hypothetical protein
VSQIVIAQFFVIAAVVLIFVHRRVTNRWLLAHMARYGRLPGKDWFRRVDPDPDIEALRRQRLLVLGPMLLCFVLALTLLLTAH